LLEIETLCVGDNAEVVIGIVGKGLRYSGIAFGIDFDHVGVCLIDANIN
jgi:hypothetical protein